MVEARASDFRSRRLGFKTTCGIASDFSVEGTRVQNRFGRASDFSVEGTRVQNHVLPFRNLGNFVHPTLPVSFERDSKSHWSLLSGVYGYARGSKRPHTGKWKKPVVDSQSW